MCIILTTFVYLQCKIALQVQSKHIKILKKQKTKNKKQKQKQSSNQLAYSKGKKKKKKEKVHLTNRINQKNTIHESLALFI